MRFFSLLPLALLAACATHSTKVARALRTCAGTRECLTAEELANTNVATSEATRPAVMINRSGPGG